MGSPSQQGTSSKFVALQEGRKYWERELERVKSPPALRLIPQLDLNHPLGFKPYDKAKGSTTLVPIMVETKLAHPTKVLLVRVRASALCKALYAHIYMQMSSTGPYHGCLHSR